MKILVPTDGSAYSQAALDSVRNRSWPDGTEITILSVLQPLVGLIDPALVKYECQMLDELGAQQMQYTEDAKRELQKGLSNCSVRVILANGNVADEILNMARKWHADLIVMGSHGRTGFEKFLLGSVAQAVVCHSPCTVEVTKLFHGPQVEARRQKGSETAKV
jgi:nucleotide-binding universal stress UspA family protein